ncbi:hypothetical protein H2200_001701 [Cladophialophora chaetospira]|uniref:Selenoprotein W-like protein n=1 Tax=Cladophialophora chaetospira TaxID=386627 RepID=A0AA39CPB2_9EURO|nr:hypothetical protein H2200_001701 [Cladophialophora chaetospira]
MEASSKVRVPRIAIEFCTQCKWNLRAAYYAQELLQTFSTSVGEIALVPATGGIFTVIMTHRNSEGQGESSTETAAEVTNTIVWDRKIDGGFPETKELKNRVRNIIEPNRDLGHIDRSLKKDIVQPATAEEPSKTEPTSQHDVQVNQRNVNCEDCK